MRKTYYDGSKGVTIDLVGEDTLWIITRVEVNKRFRRRGYAREMMDIVCADADKKGITLLLSVDPDGTGAPRSALLAFYESLGFEMHDANDGHTMQRLPKGEPVDLRSQD